MTHSAELHADRDDHDDFGGLRADLAVISRRKFLALAGGAGLSLIAAACGSDDSPSAASAAPASGPTTTQTPTDTVVTPSSAADSGSCAVIPQETAGPYPGDGTNGPNVLAESGVVRKDIRASVGGASGVAEGVPLTIRFRLTDTTNGCGPLANAAVYAWHCTLDGNYSMYSAGFEDENFLRGVQVADADGMVEFTSIFPGCYSGRWPHIHFEVYPDVDAATAQSGYVAVSQIALPKTTSDQVYATAGYQASVSNLAAITLEGDNVFGDDTGATQLGTITGDLSGFTVELVVPVDSAATASMGGGGGAPPGGGDGGRPPGPPPGDGGPPPGPPPTA